MPNHQQDDVFLSQAIQLAVTSAADEGGPFGAVIVRNGEIIGHGNNLVTDSCDPTAHAEVTAIRDACKNVNDFQLHNCTIYSSCEPCPMCLAAIYWARIPRLVYAATATQAAQAGFDDQFILQQLKLSSHDRSLKTLHIDHPQATESFKAWQANQHKKEY